MERIKEFYESIIKKVVSDKFKMRKPTQMSENNKKYCYAFDPVYFAVSTHGLPEERRPASR